MAAVSQVGFQMLNSDALIKQLEALDTAVREDIAGRAIQSGMRPVQDAMIANTPESTGSREKQSTRTRQKWSGSKKLKSTIRSVVRKMKRAGISSGVIGYVGPSYSDGGGHGNLFARDHKRKVLWGRDSGTVRIVNQFVKRTADQTRGQAAAAVISTAKAGIEAVARATNG